MAQRITVPGSGRDRESRMKTLLIMYHSQTGNTEKLAQAVYHLVQCEESGFTLTAGLALGVF
jgi:hypothetical protein